MPVKRLSKLAILAYAINVSGAPLLAKSAEIALFNGKDLSGWIGFRGSPATSTAAAPAASGMFSVSDGVLHVSGKPTGYLRTVNQYRSYTLHVEWRWVDPNPPMPNNSGILFRVGSPDRLWPMSYEAEMSEYGRANYRDLSNVGDLLILGYDKASFRSDPSLVNSMGPPEGTAGFSFKDFHRKRLADAEKPTGEWNSYDIVVDRDRITLTLNGVLVNEGHGAENVSGYIALQSEGTPIDFRNIRLRPIR